MWHSPCSAQASSPLNPNFHCYVTNKLPPINGVLWDFKVLNLCRIYCTNKLSLFPCVEFLSQSFGEQVWWIILPSLFQSWPNTQSFSRPTTTSSSPRNMRWVGQRSKFFRVLISVWLCFHWKGKQESLLSPREMAVSLLLSLFSAAWQCCSWWWCLSNYEIKSCFLPLFCLRYICCLNMAKQDSCHLQLHKMSLGTLLQLRNPSMQFK